MRTAIFKLSILTAAMLTVLVFLSTAFAQPDPSKKDQKKANQFIDQAEKGYKEKNYRNAVDRYAQAIVIWPSNAKAHFGKGVSHYSLQEYDQAISELNSAQKLGYPARDVIRYRWMAYYLKKDYDGAYADLKEGLQIEPNNNNYLKGFGEIAFNKGAIADALQAFQKAVAQEPNNADLYYNIAQCQYRLGNTAGQASAAEEAVKRNTQFIGEANFLLGDAYKKQKKNREAIVAYNKSLEKKTDLLDTYLQLADSYRAEAMYPEAIEVCKKGLQAFPANGLLFTNVAWYYSLAGKKDEAVQAALAAVKLQGDQSLPYTNLCRAYNETGDYVKAIAACNSALKLSPDDGETLYYLGYAYNSQNKKNEAAKYFDRAVNGLESFTKNNPDYSDGFYLLGNAYLSDNQEEKAITAYTKCLQLSPKFARARANLGIIHVLRKNKAAALEQYTMLLEIDPELAAKLKAEIDKL